MLCVMNNLKHTVFKKLRGSWLHAVQSVSRNLALQGSTVVSNLHIASPSHLIKGLICPYFIDKVQRQPWIQQPSQNPIAVTLQSYSHYSILPLICKQTLARVNFSITNTLRSVPFLSRNTVSQRLNVPQRRVAMGLISTDMPWESYYFASLLGVNLDTDTKEATIPLGKKKEATRTYLSTTSSKMVWTLCLLK